MKRTHDDSGVVRVRQDGDGRRVGDGVDTTKLDVDPEVGSEKWTRSRSRRRHGKERSLTSSRPTRQDVRDVRTREQMDKRWPEG